MKERLIRCNVMLYAWQVKKIKEGKMNMSELSRVLFTRYFEENDEVLEIKEKELTEQLEQVKEKKVNRDKKQQEFLERNKAKADSVYIKLLTEYLNTYKETGEFLSNDVIPELLKDYSRMTGLTQLEIKNKIMEEIKMVVKLNGEHS